MRKLCVYFASIILLFILFCSVSNTVSAGTIYVNSATGNDSTGDGSSGSPYKTFHKGYTVSSSGDTLNLTGTFTWTDADETADASTTGYTISKNLTIQGQSADATIIQAHASENSADRRVFTVSSGYTVTFDSITIRHGKAPSGGGVYSGYNSSANMTFQNCRVEYNRVIGGSWGEGGAIWAYLSGGSLTVTNCQIQHNQATGSSGSYGGAIYLRGNGTITNSTINNNSVGVWGSGIYGYYATMEITNSTFVDNIGWGAAIQSIFTGTLTITNSTIAYNDNNSLYGYATCGGIYLESGVTTHIKNTILAQNTGGNATACDWTRSGGSLSTKTNNIVENQSGSDFTNGVNNNLVGTQANLNLSSTLADNSTTGLSQTLALTTGSVAIDAGSATANNGVTIPSTDQRGQPRSGSVDIGSYELQSDSDPPTIVTFSPADNDTGIAVDANLVLTFNESVDVESGSVSIHKASDDSTVESIDVTSGQVTGTGTTTITMNPASDLAVETSYYIQIASTAFDDSAGNSFAGISNTTTWNFTTVDVTDPVITSVSASSGETSATITWSTNELASSQIEYGLVSGYGFSTAEGDTSPRVTSHSVVLNSLKSCRRYYYRVKSTDAQSNQAISGQQTVKTTGCVAPIDTGSEQTITTASGGEFQLTNSSSTAKLLVPNGFASENADFQINKLSSSTLSSIPPGKSLASQNIYDLSAIDINNSDLTSFLKPITFRITYGSDTETTFTESSLDVYRYNTGSSEWVKQNCSLDTSSNTLTCSLTSFSTYAVFGTVSTSGSSGGSGPTAGKKIIGCGDLPPDSVPDLFQIDTTKNTATLYFAPAQNFDWYYISFSEEPHAEEHGAFVQLDYQGVQKYTVEYLKPSTQYFFKVRAQRGCKPGDWSSIVKKKTTAPNILVNPKQEVRGTKSAPPKTPSPTEVSDVQKNKSELNSPTINKNSKHTLLQIIHDFFKK